MDLPRCSYCGNVDTEKVAFRNDFAEGIITNFFRCRKCGIETPQEVTLKEAIAQSRAESEEF